MSGVFPRLGIASIAAQLQRRGVEVFVVDPQIEAWDGIAGRIRERHPAWAGIPAYTTEILDAAHTAQSLKEICPDIRTVVGGSHASALPLETLREFPSFDIAVIGDGEEAMLDLIEANALHDVLGIAYRRDDEVVLTPARRPLRNLDSLAPPAWDLYDLNAYRGGSLAGYFGSRGRLLELPLESARGCPFQCIFCYRYAGTLVRYKSTQRVVDEMQRNVEVFGATRLYYVEGTFGVNRRLALELCAEIVRRGLHLKMTWSTGTRADVVDPELLRAMKEAGCRFLGIGVETANPELMRTIGKGIDLKEIEEAFAACRRLGIETEATFIIGHPYETEATVLETIRFARRLAADAASFAIMVPFPGTKVADMATTGEGGLRLRNADWKWYGKQMGQSMELEHLPYKRLRELQMRAYRSFYLKPRRIRQVARRLSWHRFLFGLQCLLRRR